MGVGQSRVGAAPGGGPDARSDEAPLSVLLVDDGTLGAEMERLAGSLAGGCVFTCVTSSLDALSLLTERRFDCCFCTQQMRAGIDGLETVRTLRQYEFAHRPHAAPQVVHLVNAVGDNRFDGWWKAQLEASARGLVRSVVDRRIGAAALLQLARMTRDSSSARSSQEAPGTILRGDIRLAAQPGQALPTRGGEVDSSAARIRAVQILMQSPQELGAAGNGGKHATAALRQENRALRQALRDNISAERAAHILGAVGGEGEDEGAAGKGAALCGPSRGPGVDPVIYAFLNSRDTCFVLSDPMQPDNPIVHASPAFLRFTGYSLHEVLGRNCRFLQGAETDQRAIAKIKRALYWARECRVCVVNYKKDGTLFYNKFFIAPLCGRDSTLGGMGVQYFVGVQEPVSRAHFEAFQRYQYEEGHSSDEDCAGFTSGSGIERDGVGLVNKADASASNGGGQGRQSINPTDSPSFASRRLLHAHADD
eukprot:g5708.t1